ncbi:DUF6356 family protein [Rhizosaccharibacter radicis]|uniref:DUF6356 family protein n=1 Tax=Rhizosaccharibacter radicis TaxID=2782605 RepID=A0ABT1VWF9_9PROT|nr:DUF6356 family protein [Acetobacteraceae bacterium KSS12]
MARTGMVEKLFLGHPRTVGESYGAHLLVASGFGLRMIGGGVACLLHGLVPVLFTTTGSRTIQSLHDRMLVNRQRHAQTRFR